MCTLSFNVEGAGFTIVRFYYNAYNVVNQDVWLQFQNSNFIVCHVARLKTRYQMQRWILFGPKRIARLPKSFRFLSSYATHCIFAAEFPPPWVEFVSAIPQMTSRLNWREDWMPPLHPGLNSCLIISVYSKSSNWFQYEDEIVKFHGNQANPLSKSLSSLRR